MITRIIIRIGQPSEFSSLLKSFKFFCSSEETTCWVPFINERTIIRPSSEGSKPKRNIFFIEELLINRLNSSRTVSDIFQFCVCAIVHTIESIGAANHVIIQIAGNVREFASFLSMGDPVFRAFQSNFLSSPPCKGDTINRCKRRTSKLNRHFEVSSRARPIIIDSRSSRNTIKMRANDDSAVFITFVSLTDNIPGGSLYQICFCLHGENLGGFGKLSSKSICEREYRSSGHLSQSTTE
mmetsp:Transcript_8505/g.12886  ORF Transcript_8505/g.12886 Transcript_8505/m.12886 type:complete len:239 (+) Transcript_8505:203-919(+)